MVNAFVSVVTLLMARAAAADVHEGFDCVPGFPGNDKRTEADLMARTLDRCAFLCRRTQHYVLGDPDGFTFNPKAEQPSKCFCEYQLVKAKDSDRIHMAETGFLACVIPDILPSEKQIKTDVAETDPAAESATNSTELSETECGAWEMSRDAWNYLSKLSEADLQDYTPVIPGEITFAGQEAGSEKATDTPKDKESGSSREKVEIKFAKVLSIVDGDTIFVGASPCLETEQCGDRRNASLFQVRLAGIDAPELDGALEEEQKVAKTAEKALRREIHKKIVRLEVTGIDTLGSLLATVYLAEDPHSDLPASKKEKPIPEKPGNHTDVEGSFDACPAGFGGDDDEEDDATRNVNPNANRSVNQYMLDVQMARPWKNGKKTKWRKKWLRDALDKWLENEWACVTCRDSS
eukprot:GEMP01019841.1.p1 GENE.GEMP01019841.1~~GEMP01019841.1.p1  ORF type:complete len:406 (+),score=97.90 GEMP01019841.1:54-1271(+)